MKKMPIEAVERFQQEMPDFVDWVQTTGPGEKVDILLDEFEDDASLLFQCIWYALSHERKVIVKVSSWDKGTPSVSASLFGI